MQAMSTNTVDNAANDILNNNMDVNDNINHDDESLFLDDDDGFDKALSSDIETVQVYKLLSELKNDNLIFNNFSDSELKQLSNGLSVLKFDANEKIITKHETASFFGILLSGQCRAIVSEIKSVELNRGALVGEMNYFEPTSTRSATIITNQESIVAIMQYNTLNTLSKFEMKSKLIWMLASAAITRLRNVVLHSSDFFGKQDPNKPTTAGQDAANNSNNSNNSTANNNANNSNTVPDFDQRHKQESLLVERLRKQSERNQALLMNEQSKRIAEEKKRRVQQYREINLTNKLSKLENELLDMRNRYELQLKQSNTYIKLNKDQVELMSTISIERNNLQKRINDLLKFNDELKKEQSKYVNTVNNLNNNINQLNFEHASEVARIQNQLNNQLISINELENNKLNNLNEINKAHTLIESLKLEKIQLNNRISELNNSIHYINLKIKVKENEYNNVVIDNCKLNNDIININNENNNKIKQYKLEINNLHRYKAKYFNEHYGTHNKYKLIQIVTLKNYIKIWRTKQLLIKMHYKLTELVIERIKEQEKIYNNNNGDNLNEETYYFYIYNNNNNDNNNIDSISNSDNNSISKINDIIQSKRDNHIKLKRSGSSVKLLVQAIDNELLELQAPIQLMHINILQLRKLLSAFFKRNIQLTDKCNALNTALTNNYKHYEKLKNFILMKYTLQVNDVNNDTNNRVNTSNNSIITVIKPDKQKRLLETLAKAETFFNQQLHQQSNNHDNSNNQSNNSTINSNSGVLPIIPTITNLIEEKSNNFMTHSNNSSIIIPRPPSIGSARNKATISTKSKVSIKRNRVNSSVDTSTANNNNITSPNNIFTTMNITGDDNDVYILRPASAKH